MLCIRIVYTRYAYRLKLLLFVLRQQLHWLLLNVADECLTPYLAACLNGLSGANKREVSCSTVHCIRPGPVAGRLKTPPGACPSSSITRAPALPTWGRGTGDGRGIQCVLDKVCVHGCQGHLTARSRCYEQPQLCASVEKADAET